MDGGRHLSGSNPIGCGDPMALGDPMGGGDPIGGGLLNMWIGWVVLTWVIAAPEFSVPACVRAVRPKCRPVLLGSEALAFWRPGGGSRVETGGVRGRRHPPGPWRHARWVAWQGGGRGWPPAGQMPPYRWVLRTSPLICTTCCLCMIPRCPAPNRLSVVQAKLACRPLRAQPSVRALCDMTRIACEGQGSGESKDMFQNNGNCLTGR